ncbi:dioxygenase family protein [Streptomyces sp. NBC_01264]|uniref:dioxygenase family protein n=1 Tax=Streptomyces sp. NBC_01264 TaxID=2903804 RepID=UPI00225168A4|nr:class III extradiol ring-cleavage dioxygenase [Streptomyces sp. NBC_01264]MCX4782723.1 dioxygenase [Streptomyces sp. NBC_01264]
MTTEAGTMPAVFVGHGSPMNALEPNEWTSGWEELARSMPRPRAILSVSAHWYVPGVRVTAAEQPRTIHDFGGFPPALHQVQYPAPGSAELCRRVTELLGPQPVAADRHWGLDHGTWSLLVHMYPEADIPVVQLSVDENLTPRAWRGRRRPTCRRRRRGGASRRIRGRSRRSRSATWPMSILASSPASTQPMWPASPSSRRQRSTDTWVWRPARTLTGGAWFIP